MLVHVCMYRMLVYVYACWQHASISANHVFHMDVNFSASHSCEHIHGITWERLPLLSANNKPMSHVEWYDMKTIRPRPLKQGVLRGVGHHVACRAAGATPSCCLSLRRLVSTSNSSRYVGPHSACPSAQNFQVAPWARRTERGVGHFSTHTLAWRPFNRF